MYLIPAGLNPYFAPLTSIVLSKGNGSLLCFARFMEREIARKNRNKCGWKMAMSFNYTSKDKSYSIRIEHCRWPR